MPRRIFILVTLIFLFFNNIPAYSNDFSNKSIEKYSNKVASKFSRTYCNSIQFGISDEGALAFAVGETRKEFKNNKINELIDYSSLNQKIVDSLKNKCQVFNFSIKKLNKLELK